MEKFYKVSESDLLELLENSIRFYILQADGVDNWEWYMEGRSEFMKEVYGNEDLYTDEAARIDLKNYEEIM